MRTEKYNIYIRNPFKTWWKVRKYFRIPKPHIHFFLDVTKSWSCPYYSIKNISSNLDIICTYESVKSKNTHYSYERPPYLWVCFFKKFGFGIDWLITYKDSKGKTQDGSTFYWEYIYDYFYGGDDINDIPDWTDVNGKNIHIENFCLKKKWLKKIKNNERIL